MDKRSVLGGILAAWDRAEFGCAGAGVLLVGGSFLMCGLLVGWRSAALTFDSVRLQGQVVRNEQRAGRDSKTYTPVVRFTAQNGKTIEFRSAYGSGRPEYKAGDRVPVVYRPASGEAEIWLLWKLWLFPVLFFGAAAALFAVAALALWGALR